MRGMQKFVFHFYVLLRTYAFHFQFPFDTFVALFLYQLIGVAFKLSVVSQIVKHSMLLGYKCYSNLKRVGYKKFSKLG